MVGWPDTVLYPRSIRSSYHIRILWWPLEGHMGHTQTSEWCQIIPENTSALKSSLWWEIRAKTITEYFFIFPHNLWIKAGVSAILDHHSWFCFTPVSTGKIIVDEPPHPLLLPCKILLENPDIVVRTAMLYVCYKPCYWGLDISLLEAIWLFLTLARDLQLKFFQCV